MTKVAVGGIFKPIRAPSASAKQVEKTSSDVNPLFESGTDNTWIENHYDSSYWKSQPIAEKNALAHYSGYGYDDINSTLRQNKMPEDKVAARIYNIDNATKKGYLKQDTVLYRGDSNPTLKRLFNDGNLVPGVIYRDKGYHSTTIQKGGGFGGMFRYKIFAPKGTRGTYIDHISHHTGEMEWLLPRGTKFKVISVKKHPAKTFNPTYSVYVEIIP